MELSITLVIIIITCITSFISFSNHDVMDKLIFYPPAVSERNEWYRFFSCGLIHADLGHLVFNMYALYVFGIGQRHSGLEYTLTDMFGPNGKWVYGVMYVSALAVCLIPTYRINKNNYYYKSLGASGAVSAVIFASILLNPLGHMGLIFIPLYIYSFLFGGLYLLATYYLDKRGGGNINHSAHLWGALFGIVFLFAAGRIFQYPVLSQFIEELKHFDPSRIIVTP